MLGYPAVKAVSNQKYRDTFFGLPETTSAKDLKELKSSVEKLKGILQEMNSQLPADESPRPSTN